MSNDDASRQDSLHEGARETNSNLQRLIEVIGGLLAASGDLLMRVQEILSVAQPAAGRPKGGDECGTPERGEE